MKNRFEEAKEYNKITQAFIKELQGKYTKFIQYQLIRELASIDRLKTKTSDQAILITSLETKITDQAIQNTTLKTQARYNKRQYKGLEQLYQGLLETNARIITK